MPAPRLPEHCCHRETRDQFARMSSRLPASDTGRARPHKAPAIGREGKSMDRCGVAVARAMSGLGSGKCRAPTTSPGNRHPPARRAQRNKANSKATKTESTRTPARRYYLALRMMHSMHPQGKVPKQFHTGAMQRALAVVRKTDSLIPCPCSLSQAGRVQDA